MNKSLDLTIENMRIQNPEMPKEALESVRSIQKNVFSFDFFSYTDNFCIIFWICNITNWRPNCKKIKT